MPRRIFWWAAGTAIVVVVALVAGAPALAAGAARSPAPAATWPMRSEGGLSVIETPHYVVRTDFAPELGQLVAGHQEALFVELARRLSVVKIGVTEIKRLDILVVGTQKKYEEVVGAGAAGSQGVFVPKRDLLACWSSPDNVDDILAMLRHEGTHQFVRVFISPKCPVWLNEGLAEFFKYGQFRGGPLEVGQVPSAPVGAVRRAIAEGRFIPVARLLALSAEEWAAAVSAGGPSAHLQYHEAWSLVYFLQTADGGRYRTPFLQYITYVARGMTGQQAWAQTFGADTTAIEKRLRQFMADLKPTVGMGCRWNLKVLGLLLGSLPSGTEIPTDMAGVRAAALDGRLGRWVVTMTDGVQMSSTDTEFFKSVFRCPEDTSQGDEPSYELVPGEPGWPPGVRCRHHAGVVLEMSYTKDPATGGYQVQVTARPANQVPGGAAATETPAPRSAKPAGQGSPKP